MSPPFDHSDADEVERVRAGDARTFEHLFRTRYVRLCEFAERYVQSPAIAEEIVQEVFRRIWQHRERWTVKGTIDDYFYKATRNQALNHLKHRRVEDRWQERMLRQWHAADAEPMALSPDHEFEADDLARRLDAAVARLPERCRMVFALKWREGMKYAEIANVMGISVKTVDNQILKALRTLRRELAGDE